MVIALTVVKRGTSVIWWNWLNCMYIYDIPLSIAGNISINELMTSFGLFIMVLKQHKL